MVKRVLLIAFQYPPMTGSSAIQRALRFSQYLPELGWEPIVLSAHPRAYERTSTDQMNDIPRDATVVRAFAWDTARHLAIRGRYPRKWAMPDRWISWWLGAVPAGLRLIERLRPHAIWSTFPIATAHQIGLTLHRRSGLPWIADFRDVMTEQGYPRAKDQWASWRRLEARTIAQCTRAVFTTPGAAQLYADRYPQQSREHFAVIENGYDENLFASIDQEPCAPTPDNGRRKLVLLHSGAIYPSERDPTHFFRALRELREEGIVDSDSLGIVLRATGHDDYIRSLIERERVADIVQLAPPVPYREALLEMMSAHGLLLLQAQNCNRQIPAKLYEYLRSGRPVVGLVSGDTADALHAAGIDTVAPLDDRQAIKQLLGRFVSLVRAGAAPTASRSAIVRQSRRHKTEELAELLHAVT
jgi:glycosyltransferase involved in cell wall biosynthesis